MKLAIYTSTITDGSMKSPDQNHESVLPARAAFLEQHDLSPADTTLVKVTYDSDDFCRYHILSSDNKGDGITRPATIEADALVVAEPDHVLLLPLADCIGAVIHDPTRNLLMLSHLGRHNIEQQGGTKSIEFLVKSFSVQPSNLTVWLSPAAGNETYPLYAFDGRSMHEVATEQLLAAGIARDHITISPIDSATDTHYFSHSQFLAGLRETDGRHAVVAVMR